MLLSLPSAALVSSVSVGGGRHLPRVSGVGGRSASRGVVGWWASVYGPPAGLLRWFRSICGASALRISQAAGRGAGSLVGRVVGRIVAAAAVGVAGEGGTGAATAVGVGGAGGRVIRCDVARVRCTRVVTGARWRGGAARRCSRAAVGAVWRCGGAGRGGAVRLGLGGCGWGVCVLCMGRCGRGISRGAWSSLSWVVRRVSQVVWSRPSWVVQRVMSAFGTQLDGGRVASGEDHVHAYEHVGCGLGGDCSGSAFRFLAGDCR